MKKMTSERAYWIGMAVAAGALVLLITLWAIPAHMASVEAEIEWDKTLTDLKRLQMIATEIPSLKSLQEREDYRKWVDREAQYVQTFFADRAAALETPLAGEGEVTPAAFKEAYIQAIDAQRRWLEQRKGQMSVPDTRRAFVIYDWVAGSGHPAPADYPEILRSYWSRAMLYQLCLASGVNAIKRMEVGRLASLSPEFDGLRVEMDILMPPDKVMGLLESMLTVSATVKNRPLMRFDHITLRPEPGTQHCSVQLSGHVLLLKRGGAPR